MYSFITIFNGVVGLFTMTAWEDFPYSKDFLSASLTFCIMILSSPQAVCGGSRSLLSALGWIDFFHASNASKQAKNHRSCFSGPNEEWFMQNTVNTLIY